MTDADPIRARLAEVEQAILARAPEHDLVPTLARITEVCGLLGDPQKAFRAVHVTGTNGKTTTTRLAERLLREHGLRTGRFTSPHLVEVRERIAVDGERLSPERFVATYDDVLPYVELVDQRSTAAGEPRMTFFEVLVAMAYAAFADAPIEVAALQELVTEVRRFRSEQGLRPGRRVPARIAGLASTGLAAHEAEIRSLATLDAAGEAFSATATLSAGAVTVELDLSGVIDVAAERRRLEKDRAAAEKEHAQAQAKLGNEQFLAKAPAQVVATIRDRLAAADAELARIGVQLGALPPA